MTRSDRILLVGVGVIGAGGFGATLGAVTYVVFDDAPSWLIVTVGIVGGGVLGAGSTWLIARRWQSGGGRSNMRAVQKAMDTRRIPSDADPEVWTDLLDHREKQVRRSLLFIPLFFVISAIYLVLGITQIVRDLGGWVWVGVAVFAFACVGVPIEARSHRRRLEMLKDQLEKTRPSAVEPPAAR